MSHDEVKCRHWYIMLRLIDEIVPVSTNMAPLPADVRMNIRNCRPRRYSLGRQLSRPAHIVYFQRTDHLGENPVTSYHKRTTPATPDINPSESSPNTPVQ